MGGIAVRTSSDSPRCAFLQAPGVVRRGTGADDILSSVIRDRQVGPWRAGGSRAVSGERCQGDGRVATGRMAVGGWPRCQWGRFRRGSVEAPALGWG